MHWPILSSRCPSGAQSKPSRCSLPTAEWSAPSLIVWQPSAWRCVWQMRWTSTWATRWATVCPMRTAAFQRPCSGQWDPFAWEPFPCWGFICLDRCCLCWKNTPFGVRGASGPASQAGKAAVLICSIRGLICYPWHWASRQDEELPRTSITWWEAFGPSCCSGFETEVSLPAPFGALLLLCLMLLIKKGWRQINQPWFKGKALLLLLLLPPEKEKNAY